MQLPKRLNSDAASVWRQDFHADREITILRVKVEIGKWLHVPSDWAINTTAAVRPNITGGGDPPVPPTCRRGCGRRSRIRGEPWALQPPGLWCSPPGWSTAQSYPRHHCRHTQQTTPACHPSITYPTLLETNQGWITVTQTYRRTKRASHTVPLCIEGI